MRVPAAFRRSARYLFVISIAFLLLPSLSGVSLQGPFGDYGDAPDGQPSEYIHLNPEFPGEFPSEYDDLVTVPEIGFVLIVSLMSESGLGNHIQ